MTTTTIEKVQQRAAEMVGKSYQHGGHVHVVQSARVKKSRFIVQTDRHEFDIDLVHGLRLLGEFKPMPQERLPEERLPEDAFEAMEQLVKEESPLAAQSEPEPDQHPYAFMSLPAFIDYLRDIEIKYRTVETELDRLLNSNKNGFTVWLDQHVILDADLRDKMYEEMVYRRNGELSKLRNQFLNELQTYYREQTKEAF